MSKTPFDFFDRICCVNLDACPERWERSRAEFDKLGILDRAERFSAFAPYMTQNVEARLLACRDTMRLLVRQCAKHQMKSVLIFEDDVVFDHYDPNLLQTALDELSTHNWWAVMLGTHIRKAFPMTAGLEFVGEHLFRIAPENQLVGGYAWALHARAYDEFLKGMDKLDQGFDQWFRQPGVCEVYGIYPIMASVGSAPSTIEDSSTRDDIHVWEIDETRRIAELCKRGEFVPYKPSFKERLYGFFCRKRREFRNLVTAGLKFFSR